MENNLHIFIDRLKDNKEEIILDTLASKDLDIKNEKELIFKSPIELEAKAYRASEELIINVNLKFRVSIPCKICNKLIEKDIEVKTTGNWNDIINITDIDLIKISGKKIVLIE